MQYIHTDKNTLTQHIATYTMITNRQLQQLNNYKSCMKSHVQQQWTGHSTTANCSLIVKIFRPSTDYINNRVCCRRANNESLDVLICE